jgi:tetratricopeptide (TPR) repeat protein
MTRRWIWLLALMVAAHIVLLPAVAGAATTPCDLAEATVRAGQLDVATQLYERLLEKKPKPRCAVTGYSRVARQRRRADLLVDQAATERKLEQTDRAMATVARALRVDPSSVAARALLRAISDTTSDAYAGARALFDAGYIDEAREEARRVAKTGEPVPADLQAADESSPARWKGRADGFVDDMGSYGAALGIVAGLLAVSVFLLWQLWKASSNRRRRVSVDKLDAPDTMVPNAEAMTAMLIDEMGSGGSGRTLTLVRDAPDSPEFDVAAALGDKWKWLGTLWKSLPFSRALTVRGDVSMAGDGEHEVRVILTIARRRTHVVTKRVFSCSDADLSKADLVDLALRDAAAWLTWKLVQEGAVKSRPRGMLDWQSWARLRQGVWYSDHGKSDAARTRYVDAVGYDHNNSAAWLNLASLDRRDDYETALERLKIADQRIVEQLGSDRSRFSSAVWYRVKNVMCVAWLNRNSKSDDAEVSADNDRTWALVAAADLVSGLVQVRRALIEDPPVGDRSPFEKLSNDEKDDLTALARNTEDTAIALLASSLVANGHLPALALPVYDANTCWERLSDVKPDGITVDEVLGCLFSIHRGGGIHWIAEYNLACMYARAYEKASNDQARAAYRAEVLLRVRRGLEGRDEVTLSYARDKDPAFDPLRTPENREDFYRVIDSCRPKTRPSSAPKVVDGWTVAVPA